MSIRHKPASIAPPFSSYSHAIEVAAGARWLSISGQVGVMPDGTWSQDPSAQIHQTWRNLLTILEGAGMGPENLVKVNTYLTRQEDIALAREIRETLLDGAEPASTLVIVAGLAHPEWLVEIEAVAASES
ncbi:MAG: RidA family protein [Kiloniellales bacterium]|nr:RidA family protein [Kiloniellales bacterium]